MTGARTTLAVIPAATRAASPFALAFFLAGSLWWKPGFVLSYDAVAVPQQSLQPWMWGAGQAPPRSVPQDAVIAVADNLIPGSVLQRAMLLAALVLAGAGMLRLLASRPMGEQLVAATSFVWSAYVVERAVIGHWGLLLAYAVMPWVVMAAMSARRGSRASIGALGLWVALGSLTPTGGLILVLLAASILLGPGSPPRRWAAVGLLVALQLPWIAAGVLHPGSSAGGSSGVFGLRADGPGGAALSALTGGGIWNADAVPGSRTGVYLIVATLALVGLAAAGLPRLRQVLGEATAPICTLGVLALAWAVLTWLAPVSTWVESMPGGGLLRDSQKWLALWMLPFSVCVGLGAGRLAGRARADLRPFAVTGLVLLPVLLLPDATWSFGSRLTPVQYPSAWADAGVEVSAAGPDAGEIVSLPWVPFRAYVWNGRRVALDPSPRYFEFGALTSSELAVSRRGSVLVVPSDDPRSDQISAALQSSQPQRALAANGVGWVLVNEGQPVPPGQPDPAEVARGAELVVDGGGLKLYRLNAEGFTPNPVRRDDNAVPWLIAAWAICGAALLFTTALWVVSAFVNIAPVSKRNIEGNPASVAPNDERSSTPWPNH